MKRSLTDAAVKRFKPPAKGQIDIFDTGYNGLALRVSYGGGKSWRWYTRVHGKLRALTLGQYPAMTLAEARQAWRDAREKLAAGEDPKPRAPKPTTTFDDVFEDWLKRDQAKNRSAKVTERKFRRNVLPRLTGRDIADIDRRDCLDVIDAVVDRGAPRQAHILHAQLKRLFNWAIGRGIIEVNPLAGVEMGKAVERDRVLSHAELVQIWNAAGDLGFPRRDAVRMLILTGCRRGEIGGLRRDEIRDELIDPEAGDGRTVRVIALSGERTKNGEQHLVPLSAAAQAILDSVPHIAGGFVFSTRGGKPMGNWDTCKEALDKAVPIPHWTIHDLRRTCATNLQKLGVPVTVTEACLGHTAGSRGGIVGIYQRHSYLPEKTAALESWGAKVIGLVEGRKGADVVPLKRPA